MLPDNIVLNAMLINTGTQSLKNVLHASQDTPGTAIPTNAHVVKHQDQLSMDNAHAHHQKLNGMLPTSNAFAQQTHSETTVNHVQHQESGTIIKTNVYAQHQQLTGTKTAENANVQQEDTDPTAFHAQAQDIGTSIPTNVHVKVHSFGMEATVHAHNHGSPIKEDV